MSQPIRMCIVCRQRSPQNSLERLQVIEGKLALFSKTGRSFYICKACMIHNEKKVVKILNTKCKTNHTMMMEFGKNFKEIWSNG
ncbi:MAG: DUF448 domain-containing protein [Campylobacteraceae bacterium]|nr:DUF448 domain-containing protein [Campylobacteraceae bacterium]